MVYPEKWTCPSCSSININTTKCTTCNYEPPTESGALEAKKETSTKKEGLLKERILAYLIDMSLLIGMGVILGLATAGFLQVGVNKDFTVVFMSFGLPIILIFIAINPLYFMILEGIYAQTYGKRIMKIKVHNEGGMNITKGIIRSLPRIIETIIFYIPSIILIIKTSQSVGDKIAGTKVVKTKLT